MANERTALLIGEESASALAEATVLVVGTGGVGGMAVESLARSGVGRLILVDRDVVEASNTNRQLAALTDTVGQPKTEVLAARIRQIDPEIEVIPVCGFYDRNMNDRLDELHPDFVLDCIDSLHAKQDLIEYCTSRKIPFVSSMGMARRKDPSQLAIMELDKTAGDPLAKRLRVWRRKQRIREKVFVCCSRELPGPVQAGSPLPSMMFVPAAAGLVMGAECIRQLTEKAAGQNRKENRDQQTDNTDASCRTEERNHSNAI